MLQFFSCFPICPFDAGLPFLLLLFFRFWFGLQKNGAILRQEILLINDTESSEWKNKKKRLQELNKRLNEARKNAANDIFERMNSGGNMGALIEEEDVQIQGLVHVDLHGLHVKEAKERVNEYVLPILPALKKVILITGYVYFIVVFFLWYYYYYSS